MASSGALLGAHTSSPLTDDPTEYLVQDAVPVTRLVRIRLQPVALTRQTCIEYFLPPLQDLVVCRPFVAHSASRVSVGPVASERYNNWRLMKGLSRREPCFVVVSFLISSLRYLLLV